MVVRFNNLVEADDWAKFYKYLRSKFARKLVRSHKKENDEVTLVKWFPEKFTTEEETKKACCILVNSIGPVRASLLDSQRRFGGTLYAMLGRYPETSTDDLVNSFRPDNDGSYLSGKKPDMKKLSIWMNCEAVIPYIKSDDPADPTISALTLSLLRRHSELIQSEQRAATNRKLVDTIGELCKMLTQDQVTRNTCLNPGEQQYRLTKKDREGGMPKPDSKVNVIVYDRVRDKLVSFLFKDTAKSVADMMNDARKGMKNLADAGDEREQLAKFIEINNGVLKNAAGSGPFTMSKPTLTRPDMNMIVSFVANYAFDVDSVSTLISLLSLQIGSESRRIGVGGDKDMEGNVIGLPSSGSGSIIMVSRPRFNKSQILISEIYKSQIFISEIFFDTLSWKSQISISGLCCC
jgi:hypothetical protein